MDKKTFVLGLFLLGMGSFPCAVFASVVVPFNGMIDLNAGKVEVHLGGQEAPSAHVKIERPSVGKYHVNIDLNHVPTPLCDLATVIDGDFKISGADRGHREFTGRLNSQYTLLDHKPVYDLQMKFAVKDRKFYVDLFEIGSLSARGQIGLTKDRPVSLWIDLLPVDIEEAFALLGYDEEALEMTGMASGTLNIAGPLRRPDIKGKLSFYNGELKAYPYENILLQFDGVYPLITLKDSIVNQMSGFSFKLAGSVDLEKLDRLPVQLKDLRRTPIVSGMDANKREWVFKRVSEGDAVTEMKYLFLKDDRGDTEGVLGFERKIGF
jgi:hypothetical protein